MGKMVKKSAPKAPKGVMGSAKKGGAILTPATPVCKK